MIEFGNHRYTKEPGPNSTPVPTYIFTIKNTDEELGFICQYDNIKNKLAECLQKTNENYITIVSILSALVGEYKNIFVKSYTGDQLAGCCENIIINHRFDCDDVHKSWSCIPKEVRIRGGRFYIYWDVTEKHLEFDIQLDEIKDNDCDNDIHKVTVNVEQKAVRGQVNSEDTVDTKDEFVLSDEQSSFANRHHLKSDDKFSQSFKEVSLDDLNTLNDTEVVKLRSKQHNTPAIEEKRKRDKQRVEEARLRAKLAVYEAERTVQKYIRRYGDYDDFSVTSDDSEYTTDSEFNSDSGDSD